MNDEVVLPRPDRDSTPWWEALARHELVNQLCSSCSTWRWPPRAMCGACGGFEWTWRPMSGRGVAASWIVTHHRFSASHLAPVTLVFVRPIEQDDIVMPGFWLSASPPVTGMSVAVNFVDGSGSEGSATLLGWQPA